MEITKSLASTSEIIPDNLNGILGVIASTPACNDVSVYGLRPSRSSSLTSRRAHVRIKSVYIVQIPAIRITGSSCNFASRRVFEVSCLVAINFGVST